MLWGVLHPKHHPQATPSDLVPRVHLLELLNLRCLLNVSMLLQNTKCMEFLVHFEVSLMNVFCLLYHYSGCYNISIKEWNKFPKFPCKSPTTASFQTTAIVYLSSSLVGSLTHSRISPSAATHTTWYW